jgi:integrase
MVRLHRTRYERSGGSPAATTGAKPAASRSRSAQRGLSRLEADPVAVRRDLPDLTRWFLATGVRIGEAIAVGWENIDLEGRSVQIDHKII